jgi:hypothetical protein
MWLLPTGYSFLLQAGSSGNDTFPTTYALAAIDFGIRAWRTKRISDLWLSILSAALLTGAKASNLPLLLPWGVLMLAVFYRFWKARQTGARGFRSRELVLSAVVVMLAALVSFLPTAVLNIHFCGDWSGLNLEHVGMDMKNPLVGIWGNAFLLLLNNFVPPFFPQAGWWNQSALTLLPKAIVAPMVANFEQGFLTLGEMPTEDWVGIGLGVSLLMAIAAVVSLWAFLSGKGRRNRLGGDGDSYTLPALLRWILLISPWVSLLAYCIKSGMVTGARLISPYYPLLLPLLIVNNLQSVLIRQRWWRGLTFCVLLLAVPVLALTPGRPLWPAQTILSKALQKKPGNRALSRALNVYTVYAHRPDPLAELREILPNGLARVGFMGTEDDIDVSLWRPFGSARVEHILLSDSRAEIRRRGLHYVVVGGYYLSSNNDTLERWVERTGGGEVIGKITATQKVSEGPQPWYVVQLRD